MEKFEPKIESKIENIQEVEEVKFEDLEKGDKLVVGTSMEPESGLQQYEIIVEKIAKTKEGKIKHLFVELKDPDEEEILEAKIPGGYGKVPEEYHYQYIDRGKPGVPPIPEEVMEKIGLMPGIIEVGENNCLHFDDVNYKNRFEETKSGKRKAFHCRSMTTSPIRKILLIREAK